MFSTLRDQRRLKDFLSTSVERKVLHFWRVVSQNTSACFKVQSDHVSLILKYTQNGGFPVPYFRLFLGVGFQLPLHRPYPYSEHIGEDSSILGTWTNFRGSAKKMMEGWNNPLLLARGIYGCWTKHRGIFPPKWMVKIMENPMNKWMIWGVFPLFLETPI